MDVLLLECVTDKITQNRSL